MDSNPRSPVRKTTLIKIPRPIRQFPFCEPVVIELPGTVIAKNVGGAVIPGLLSRKAGLSF
jgi:uncharacterized membrane protein